MKKNESQYLQLWYYVQILSTETFMQLASENQKNYSKDEDMSSLKRVAAQKKKAQEELEEQQSFPWRNAFNLIKGYFVESDEKLIAWLLIIGIIISVLAFVGLVTALSWWMTGFWAAVATHAWTPVLMSIAQFGALLTAIVVVEVLRDYQTGVLSILWINWLRKTSLKNLLHGDRDFLDINQSTDDLQQRIAYIDTIGTDIPKIVETTLKLGTNVLRAILTFSSFAGTLWVVGGSLQIGLTVVIPGYLVWVALLVAVLSLVGTHCIGKSLSKKSKAVETAKADFQQEIKVLNDEAENITLEKGQEYYYEKLAKKVDKISSKQYEKKIIESKVVGFQNFTGQASTVIPLVASIPLYFLGLIELAQIMQIAMAFGQVSDSCNFLAYNYEEISHLQGSLERFLSLQAELDKKPIPSIVRQKNSQQTIYIKDLTIIPAENKTTMLDDLTLEFLPKENVLIIAPSGLGKSTLFKAAMGGWRQPASGSIYVPKDIKRYNRYCLPQKAHLPDGTFKGLLAYPDPETTYKDEDYIRVLTKVGLEDKLALLKDTQCKKWEFSGGERQRIAFARALLKKPNWLFLDEATASLDKEREKELYQSLNEELPDTTVISISHNPEVRAYHHRILFFDLNPETKRVEMREERVHPKIIL
jgi:putative ATP-binding cassette transporter